MTPHNTANPGDFAKTVLMPGDPIRARHIAEHYLEAAHLINDVRGVQGYSGYYKMTPVSVMASGMGIPSISIYAHELFTEYDVDNIIRVGTAGALKADMKLGCVVAGMGACTDSNVMAQMELGATFAPIADYDLLSAAVAQARAMNVKIQVGNLYTTDVFYDAATRPLRMTKLGVLACEMEAAGLYLEAAKCGKHALALCSISDNIITGEALDADSRVTSFEEMIIIALDTAVAVARDAVK